MSSDEQQSMPGAAALALAKATPLAPWPELTLEMRLPHFGLVAPFTNTSSSMSTTFCSCCMRMIELRRAPAEQGNR